MILKKLQLVGRGTGIDPFQHLGKIILVPAPAVDHEHILELGTLHPMFRGERRMAIDEPIERHNFHVRDSPQLAELKNPPRTPLTGFGPRSRTLFLPFYTPLRTPPLV